MHVSTRLNYYYGKAQHKGNATWGHDGAFAHNAIYVDIDAHASTTGLYNPEYVAGLLQIMLPDYGKLVPNYAIGSGRGLHLVWLINQVPASLGWMVRAVTMSYSQVVATILRDYGVTGYGEIS